MSDLLCTFDKCSAILINPHRRQNVFLACRLLQSQGPAVRTQTLTQLQNDTITAVHPIIRQLSSYIIDKNSANQEVWIEYEGLREKRFLFPFWDGR